MTNPKDKTATSPVSVSDDDMLTIAYMGGVEDAKADARAKIEALQSTVKEMREALEKVREDINWMQNNWKMLNDFAFIYVDDFLAKHKEQDHE